MTELLILLFILLPIYLVRFSIGPLPTTLLEIIIWIVTVVWLLQKNKLKKIWPEFKQKVQEQPWLFGAIGIFLLGATVNVFLSYDIRAAAGEWRAFYLEPIIIFYILIDAVREKKQRDAIVLGLILCGLATSLLAIYQHFTGWLVPYSFWANRNTYRVTGWYGFPNGVGLFLAPLIPLAFYLIKNLKNTWLKLIPILFIPTGLLAIIFSKTTAGLIGLAAGLGFYFLLNKKTRVVAIVGGILLIIGIILVPNSNSVKQEILAQDYSGHLRRDIWSETITYLKIHPLRGTGLAAYAHEITPFRHNKNIEVFHHPHNIFLTMWVNTGLVGLLGFLGILIWFFKEKNKNELGMALIITMIIWLTMGLVDSPYIKNDWALFFWLLIALNFFNQTYGKYASSHD